MVEFMSQCKLNHNEKPGNTARPFRPSIGNLSSAHP